MPLPEAEKDRRLYESLKTQDLENLSYADFQAAAESVFVEDVNEDTLRRIVLIQLARMSVAGEWNGILNAGGSGAPTDAEYVTLATDATLTNERVLTAGSGITITDAGAGSTVTIASTGGAGGGEYGVGGVMASSDDVFVAGDAPPFGGAGAGTTANIQTNNVNCYPFIAPKTGNVSSLSVRVNSGAANTLLVQICADSGTGYPTTLVGNVFEIDCSAAGIISETAVITTSLVQGTKYWLCYCWDSNYGAASPSMYIHNTGASSGWTNNISYAAKLTITDVGSTNSLPSTMSTSGYTSGFNRKVRVGIEYA